MKSPLDRILGVGECRPVEARGGLRIYDTQSRIPLRFTVPCGNRDSVQHLREHVSRSTTRSGNSPRQCCNAGGGFFFIQPCTHRESLRRTAGEGMARGRATAQPRLIGRASSPIDQSAGCNTGPRKQASVGDGDHCVRVFQVRSDRPTVSGRRSIPLPENALGVVCAPLTPSHLSRERLR